MSPFDVPIALALIVSSLTVLAVKALRARRTGRASTPRPVRSFRKCWTSGCRYPATVMVVRRLPEEHTVEVLDVCEGCANEGTAFGWWFRLRIDEPIAS